MGRFDWEDSSLSPVPYRKDISDWDFIKRAASGIKIIHEDIEKDSDFINARCQIENADRIYFLGFGFNETNMQRLGVKSRLDPAEPCKKIMGTSYGLSLQQRKFVKTYREITSNSDLITLHNDKIFNFLYNKVLLD